MSRYQDGDNVRKRKPLNKTLGFLLSACIFLFILCACLLTALVLIGKHIIYNSPESRRIPLVSSSSVNSPVKRTIISKLPNDTVPILYDLTLLPDLDSGNYRGYVNITLNVTSPRKDIVIHSKNLSIDTVELRRTDWKVFQIGNVNESVVDEVLYIISKEIIPPGSYFLFIKFKGSLLNKFVGFYKSTYKNNHGSTRNIATTKFEPTYARQAFPCFDEPQLKAKYKVHLLKPADEEYIALSNNPVESTDDPVDGKQLVNFMETVSMSTYLSCFIVCDFKSKTTDFTNIYNTTPISVYATPAQLDKTSYALKVGKEVIEYYVGYFGMPYPLPKLDMIAIPDFVSGAMEHWGLVTYRETALLFSDTTHSSSNQQRVATVIAHELAHSWFGNLVTMKWWDNLWLNEGFASYIEYKGINAVHPDWKMLDQFLTAELHSVLSLDSTLSSRPIIKTVETPDQITEIFDTISYNKGASVLRMLEDAVGADIFQKGVTAYLNKYEYSNAVTENFLTELQTIVDSQAKGINISAFMDTFTIQMGYPILTVTINEDGNYVLTQKRFIKDPDATFDETESIYGYKWTVPITYISDKGKSQEPTFFKYSDDQVIIEKPTGATWFKLNHDQVGYYRVNYPEQQWKELINVYNQLSTTDRTHLLEETFSIAQAGLLSYEIPLELTKELTNEEDYVPWSVASSVLGDLVDKLKNSKSITNLKTYIQNLVNDVYEKLTWNESGDPDDDTKHLIRLCRVTVLSLACSVGHPKCLEEADNKFTEWLNNDTNALSQDLRGIIYKYGMKNVNEESWQKMFERFVAEGDATEKLKLMNGLASVQNPTLLSRLIEEAKDEAVVRSQDYFTLLTYISSNPVGTPIVWDYVRENWEELVKRFTLNDRYLGNLIPSITSSFSTDVKLKEMEQFFERYPEAGAGKAARTKALENVNNNIKWLSKYKSSVEKWIDENHEKSI